MSVERDKSFREKEVRLFCLDCALGNETSER